MLPTSNDETSSCTPCNANTRIPYIAKLNCVQEDMIKFQIKSVIKAGIKLEDCRIDSTVFNSALEGLANGTALRIAEILNVEPEYTNLTRI
jgi:hypothetical protein